MELSVRGKRAYAATGGRPFDPTQPTVGFLHGAGMDHTVWALQTRWFAHHGRNVLAFDLPGHGRSDGAALKSVGEMADWVLEALAASGAGAASLVGHSMGALIALEAAARAPERVQGLALLGTNPLMPVHPELLAAAERGEHKAIDLITTWALGKRAQLGANEAPGLWMTDATVRLLERARPKTLAGDFVACDAYKGAEKAARKVTCPVLVLAGAEDRMTPAKKSADFSRSFGNASFQALPGAGHMMMVEQPTATLAALRHAL